MIISCTTSKGSTSGISPHWVLLCLTVLVRRAVGNRSTPLWKFDFFKGLCDTASEGGARGCEPRRWVLLCLTVPVRRAVGNCSTPLREF